MPEPEEHGGILRQPHLLYEPGSREVVVPLKEPLRVSLPLSNPQDVRQMILDDLAEDGPIAKAVLKLVTQDIIKDSQLRRTLQHYLR